MKIVAGTDFSEQAYRATETAAALARQLGDTLVLAHAFELPAAIPRARPEDVDRLRKEVVATATRQLDGIAALLRKRQVEVQLTVIEGSPATALLDLGRREQARFIAVGTHGRHAPARWFVGSVAQGVASRSDRPVLVVRDAPPALDADREPHTLRALVAFDASRASQTVMDTLGQIRLAVGCDATFLHVYWPPAEFERLGLVGPREILARDEEVVNVIERELRPRVAGLVGAGNVALRIEPSNGALPEVLAAAAEAGHFDLIMAGTHQWRGLEWVRHGSVSQGLIHVAHVPLLLVPDRGAQARVPTIHRVLVGTDFSKIGNGAVPYAYALLEGRGGDIDLCYVHERELASPIYAYEPRGPGLSVERRAGLERDLAALAVEGASAPGINTHVHVVEARSAAEGIVQAAERIGADAICVGSHGRSGLAAALGSVAATVIKRSSRPVLVVRHVGEK